MRPVAYGRHDRVSLYTRTPQAGVYFGGSIMLHAWSVGEREGTELGWDELDRTRHDRLEWTGLGWARLDRI